MSKIAAIKHVELPLKYFFNLSFPGKQIRTEFKMKTALLFSALLIMLVNVSVSQTDTLKTISEQIKLDRDNQLQELQEKLKRNEEVVNRLTEKLADSDYLKSTDKEKMVDLEKLQIALDYRLKILEEAPKTRINLNGQLAFTELLSIQRDIQPADLFLTSRTFFSHLGNISSMQQYGSFNSWKAEFDKWNSKQKGGDLMLDLVNSSLNLIGSATSSVPLYGSIAQTVSYGTSSFLSTWGSKDRELATKTVTMLKLLNAVSQFEQQKAIIDHEWDAINRELEQLQKENTQLLAEQMEYFGLNANEYKTKYINETLDSKRENYKNACRKIISDKISAFEADADLKGKWLGQVETYMYKVQSLRLRFGQLTSRMLSNIESYEQLISMYSDSAKFPVEFTASVVGLGNSLKAVKNKFYTSFNPSKYIEDSAVMYIER